MDGLHTNQKFNTQDGGVQQKIIRFIVQSQNLYIVKGTIQYIAK
jgi:hypothetical protein